MTKAILVNFHLYTPYGKEYYYPILDFFLQQMKKYEDEYDAVYFIDSNWEIEKQLVDERILDEVKGEIIRVNPHLRYYDAYKTVLPQIKEDAVLFLDNDMVIYKQGVIKNAFAKLQSTTGTDKSYDVVSIYDTIGSFHSPLLNDQSKFCPYFFCTTTELLKKFTDFEWGPVPWGETLSELTIVMLAYGCKPYEIEEDKTEVQSWNPLTTEKTLGHYHIRAGSTSAYLLATKKYGDKKTYNNYLKNQPIAEIVRHCNWYKYMGGDPQEILDDLL